MSTLLDTVLQHAESHPSAPALCDASGVLSYGELASAALQLSGALRERGVTPGEVVALDLPVDRHAIIALLACWAAGAAFLFIDPADCSVRLTELLAELHVPIRIGQPTRPALDIPQLAVELRAAPYRAGPPSPDALAYVVATSGSSGAPKGVRVGHRGLLPMLRAQVDRFGIDAGARVLLGTPLCFDASLSDIGTALLAGAQLFIPPVRHEPAALHAFMEQHRVTHADLPPAMMRMLASPPAGLRCAVVGGEVVAAGLLRHWAKRTRVIVCYGPTETTVCSSMATVDPRRWERAEIGAPMPHLRYRLVDDDGRDSDCGELWIAGAGVALGYVNRPEQQQTRFVEHDGRRWYRTGDWVRRDGERWLFVGRRDRRAKIAGRMICPEEVEAVLLDGPELAEAAVVVRDIPRLRWPARRTLVAFVVYRAAQGHEALQSRLLERLPVGMHPRLVVLKQLPRTATGKIDYARLQTTPFSGAIPAQSAQHKKQAGAQSDEWQLVSRIAQLMAEILALPHIAHNDDFVALGGDSMAAIELVAAAELTGIQLATASILCARTPRRIAAEASSTSWSQQAIAARVEQQQNEVNKQNASYRHDAAEESVVVFTGATGFFGSRLLAAWLQRTEARALCLVRARDDRHAQRRLHAALTRQQHSWHEQRVEAIAADCTAPWLGLSPAAYEQLSRRISAVVHAAADTNTAASFETLARTNIDGTRELLALARHNTMSLGQAASRPRPFHHISSLAVLLCGEGAPAHIDETCPASIMQRMHGAYAATKLGAEMLLQGDPHTCIHRLGLLVADGPGAHFGHDDLLSAFVRGCARIGLLPAGDHERLRFDVTQVDIAAQACAQLISDNAAPGRYHISSRRGATLAQLSDAIRATGVALQTTSPEAFDVAVRAAPTQDGARAALAMSARLRGCPRPDLDLFLMTDRTLDSERTQALSGIHIPEPSAAQLERLVRHILTPGERA